MSDLRPTMDKVRETLFNIIIHGISFNIEGSRVLDLFCGTGALGLEALSRGAEHVSFVDNKKNSLGIVNKNSFRLNAEKKVKLIQLNAAKLIKNPDQDYNLIFLDPPYGMGLGELAVRSALENGWISDDALLVLEEKSKVTPPDNFILIRSTLVGNSCLNFLRRNV